MNDEDASFNFKIKILMKGNIKESIAFEFIRTWNQLSVN